MLPTSFITIINNPTLIYFQSGYSPRPNQNVIVQPTNSAQFTMKDDIEEDEFNWDKLL